MNSQLSFLFVLLSLLPFISGLPQVAHPSSATPQPFTPINPFDIGPHLAPPTFPKTAVTSTHKTSVTQTHTTTATAGPATFTPLQPPPFVSASNSTLKSTAHSSKSTDSVIATLLAPSAAARRALDRHIVPSKSSSTTRIRTVGNVPLATSVHSSGKPTQPQPFTSVIQSSTLKGVKGTVHTARAF
ncbi:hypothetical protein DACRYDRAFT_25365 [Dacryopinax primogenitus]|uniref:FAS1 domain-containing protein n=1 Tax=Dacryopinax primogenitus (strain DJM 731) TaxID=1858805 RepID=M5FZJ9_DACPD|nr:uncharacterized protein DACRYDRAFT_25365 [Dacryopinax primogenitus]EJT96927.1 hypothetical protein DACRYDRAFT_25365 [Dacryopinax primogenitus]